MVIKIYKLYKCKRCDYKSIDENTLSGNGLCNRCWYGYIQEELNKW